MKMYVLIAFIQHRTIIKKMIAWLSNFIFYLQNIFLQNNLSFENNTLSFSIKEKYQLI